MAGFSISGPLYLVMMADATARPLTWSASGSSKRNFLVLWLMFSILSNFKLMKPWSPPVNAAFPAIPSAFDLPFPTASLAFTSASLAAFLTFDALSPEL